MAKNKDPAVLFYTSDFLIGVMTMNMQERGEYITLLCMQHQSGHLEPDFLKSITKSPKVLAKFELDERGLYFNDRMEEEIAKRAKYITAQQQNGAKGGRPRKPKENPRVLNGLTQTKPKQNPAENENINVNINKDISDTNIFSFPNTTTTTNNNKLFTDSWIARGAFANEDEALSDPVAYINSDACRFYNLVCGLFKEYARRGHPEEARSCADDFIVYNRARGWLGIGGELIVKDEDTLERYVEKWMKAERK